VRCVALQKNIGRKKRTMVFKKRIRVLLAAVSFGTVICFNTVSFAEGEAQKSEDKRDSAQAEEFFKQRKGQQIVVDGEKVEFFEKENKITAEGKVSIKYGDVTLYCDKIEVNTREQKAICQGNVRIEHPDGVLTGDYIMYDLLEKRGEILSPEVKAFPWFGQAKETSRVGDNEYLLKKGFVSTCDMDEPHYRIAAEEIRIFPDDKVIAKNAIVYVGKVPVVWLPYYYHPIIQSRAKVQFIPGQSSDWGYFLLSSWRFYVKGNTHVDLLLDYRTKKGFAEGANFYYFLDDFEATKGLGQGLFRMYYIQQNGPGTYAPKAFRDNEGTDPKQRERFQWFHRIDFDPRTVGMLEFNKMSDEYVIKDYFYNEYEEGAVFPRNYVSIITAQPNFTLGVNVEKRYDDFVTVVEKLPEVRLDIPDQRLWETPVYYKNETIATCFDKEYAYQQNPPEKVQRFDSFHKFSYVTKLGPVSVTPYGTFRETFYSRNIWTNHFLTREAIGGGLDTACRFHKLYNFETDFMGLNINGVRHIISPRVSYFHLHQPTVDKDELYQMDSIDSLEKENGIAFFLETKLQTKRFSEGGEQSVDFLRFTAETDYLFRTKKGTWNLEKTNKFTDPDFRLELSPYSWLYFDSQLTIVPKNQSVSLMTSEMSLKPWDRFRMALGYRYEKLVTDIRDQLTFDMEFIVTPKWKIRWYERFDLNAREVEEQQFIITRDLHCWEAELTYDVEGDNLFGDSYTVWLAFKIKAFPDLPIGLDRTFSKRPAGSMER